MRQYAIWARDSAQAVEMPLDRTAKTIPAPNKRTTCLLSMICLPRSIYYALSTCWIFPNEATDSLDILVCQSWLS